MSWGLLGRHQTGGSSGGGTSHTRKSPKRPKHQRLHPSQGSWLPLAKDSPWIGRGRKNGGDPPSPALSYNVTAACDVFAGQVALAPGGRGSAKDAPRSQTARPALRPVPFPASQRGGTRTQPAAKDIFQPFAQAAGKGGAGQEPVERPALAQRDEGNGPRRQLHVPASHRHLAPLFHTS